MGAGQSHTLVVKSDGTVWAPGSTRTRSSATPRRRAGGPRWCRWPASPTPRPSRVASPFTSPARRRHAQGGRLQRPRGRVGDGGTQHSAPRRWPSARSRVSPRSPSGERSQHRARSRMARSGRGDTTTSRSAWRRHDDQSPFAVSKITSLSSMASVGRRGWTQSLATDTTGWSSPGARTTAAARRRHARHGRVPAAIGGASYDWRVATPTFERHAWSISRPIDRWSSRSIRAGATIHYTQNGVGPDGIRSHDCLRRHDHRVDVADVESEGVEGGDAGKRRGFRGLRAEGWCSRRSIRRPGHTRRRRTVTIGTTTSGATIHYTIDTTEPTHQLAALYGADRVSRRPRR